MVGLAWGPLWNYAWTEMKWADKWSLKISTSSLPEAGSMSPYSARRTFYMWLRWGSERRRLLWIARWASWSHKSPCGREAGGSEGREGDGTVEPAVGRIRRRAEVCRWLLKTEQGKEWACLSASSRNWPLIRLQSVHTGPGLLISSCKLIIWVALSL